MCVCDEILPAPTGSLEIHLGLDLVDGLLGLPEHVQRAVPRHVHLAHVFLADDAACRYADVHGDDLFKKTVDGTELNAVTTWFYGSLPVPVQTRRLDRTRQFDVQQLLLLEAVDAKSQLFIGRAGLLPFMHRAHLKNEEKRWNARYNKARELIVACSPACQGFLWLLDERKLPLSVALDIMAFEGGAGSRESALERE